MTKVYKVTVMVVDYDGVGPDEVRSVIEHARYPNHCIMPRVIDVETREVAFHDQHPLNIRGASREEFKRLFGQNGDQG